MLRPHIHTQTKIRNMTKPLPRPLPKLGRRPPKQAAPPHLRPHPRDQPVHETLAVRERAHPEQRAYDVFEGHRTDASDVAPLVGGEGLAGCGDERESEPRFVLIFYFVYRFMIYLACTVHRRSFVSDFVINVQSGKIWSV